MNYLIVVFKNKLKQKIIKKFKTSKRATDFYKSILEKNDDIIFETKHENGKYVEYEIALLEKKGNTLFPIYTKDEFGRNVKLEFDDDEYNIVKIGDYKVPEQILDYQTKNRISIETFINKYLSKTGVKLVSKLNNKIVVQNEDEVNMFTMKNESDAQRLIENLTQRFVKLKRGDCMFVLDVSSPQRKYLYKLLTEKGYDVNYLYRKETTY
jgi:hypothetical protein